MTLAKRIHHVGVGVRDLERTKKALERLGVGLAVTHDEVIGGVRLAILPLGDSAVELIEPLRDGTKIGRWMDERGEGLHHICLEVDQIDAALADLKARGVALLDDVARLGHHGSRIAFIDPTETPGLLVELLETRANP